MAAATRAYRAVRPDVRLAWDARPLAQFNDQPVWDVAGDYDLIFVDHPTMGAVAARQALVPLDTVLPAADLAAIGARSIGGSHGSYERDGHLWALGVDAACQVAAYRTDRLPTDLPTTWDDVLTLARSGVVALPLYPSDAICTLMSLSANASLAAGEAATWLHPDAAEFLVELAELVDPWCFEVNPPTLLTAMAGDAHSIAYVPLLFGYATLSRPPLRFADVPGVDGRPRGAVLGGAGLAVPPASAHVAEAAAFAAWCLDTDVQRDVVLPADGQPADRLVWDTAGGFFADTRATMDAAYLRPRDPWWPEAQRDAGRLLVSLLREGTTAARVVKELTALTEEAAR